MSTLFAPTPVRTPAASSPPPPSDQSSFTREQILDGILALNQSAPVDFLASFSDRALRLYMEHLQAAAVPRGRNARWVRPNDTRAISMHEPVD